ncbi:MAG: response regulator, partial [Gemmatimonadales bacterium]
MHVVRVPDRILVVHRDPAFRQDIETHLTHRGYEVLTATNGEEALGSLVRQKVACMITDGSPSGTPDGELLSQALTRDPTLAILVCSATAIIEDAVHYLQYGALDYLLKPVDPARLEASLERALRRRVELIRQRDMTRL